MGDLERVTVEAICALNTYETCDNGMENLNYIDLFAPKPCTKTSEGPSFPAY